MTRPTWSGQIQISLVSFGVKFFPATNPASQIQFHEIDRKTGERVRRQRVVSDEEPVDRSEIVKGFEYRKGEYVTLEPDEIKNLRIPSGDTLAIEQFVDVSEIPPGFFEKPYFVVPEDNSQAEAFNVIREALGKSGKAAIGEVAFGGREHLVAITSAPGAKGLGLMAYTMRYAKEMRQASEYFPQAANERVDASQLSLAKELIRRNTKKFSPEKYTDDYEAALREAIDAKLKHKPVAREEKAARAGKVVNLMDALKKSVQGQAGRAQKKPPARAGATRHAAGANPRSGGIAIVKSSRGRKTA